MRIYIAGPYTKGDIAMNVRAAIMAGNRVLDKGHIPYIPHLTHFWHLLCPHPWSFWLHIDKEWLRVCDGVWRLPGTSVGATEEVSCAEAWGIKVYHSYEEIPGQ